MEIMGRNIARAQEGKEIKAWKAVVYLSASHLRFSLAAASSLFSVPPGIL